ncbi:D-glycerate dehydrogenase [Dyella sp.]|jgi:gluconate 2-dehydrogenase|uniref:2-hydroxyacid dehydrogenase n=1 Tax=Dyella sp. TaxID=1869338 RepID=UPI002D76EE3A|nr:D-glycerate dehydrogenase [Dyella sp.]HET6432609.1 D-glycerate dehydrogenase [Dyella sp.]
MTKRYKVWVSRPLFAEALARLDQHVTLVAEATERQHSPAQLRERLADVDAAIIGLSDRVDAATLAGNERLRVIANLAVGYNNLDIDALTRAGVLACNTPDVLNETTADYAWALLLAAARRVGAAERWLRSGQWTGTMRIDDWLGVDLHGRTLGILGMGRIGQAVARRAGGFDMRVLYHNRHRLPEVTERQCAARWVDQPTLLAESDHLVLALPYTPGNHHIIGAAELARMKRGSVLVNIARGGLVDEAALAAALAAGQLAAAGLDVYEDEPVVHPALLALDQVVLSPHLGSASADTRRNMAHLAVDNVLAGLGLGSAAGDPPTPINPQLLHARPAPGKA